MTADAIADVLGERLVAYHHDTDQAIHLLKFESGTILRWIGGQSEPISSEEYGISDRLEDSYEDEWIEVGDRD